LYEVDQAIRSWREPDLPPDTYGSPDAGSARRRGRPWACQQFRGGNL